MMNLTIFKRLALGYAAIMVLVVFQGGYTTLKLNQIHRLIKTIDLVEGATVRLAEHLSDNLFSQIAFEKKYLVSRDADFYEQFRKTTNYILAGMSELELLADTPDKKRLALESRRLYEQYLSIFNEEVGLVTSETAYSLGMYQDKNEQITDSLNQTLKQIIRQSKNARDKMISASNEISYKIFNFTAVIAGLVILLGVLISFFNTRSINRPISILKNKTRDISEGNFDVAAAIRSPPEIMELNHDFNVMCERLKELEEMKIDFVSHVSHELRTPLTVIKEASCMLLEGTYRTSEEKQHELLSIMNEECVRMITAVNRILDLSRMEARMMNFYFVPCDFKTLLMKSVSKIRPLFERKKIRLELNVPENIPRVSIDKQQVEQVIENLLGNALKYTPDQGSVFIDASLMPNAQEFITVSISDTGSGIAKADLNKIFDKFQRIENGKETVRGTGLGLPIAKHIIAAHGGRIWVESTTEKGSTFYFTLPVYVACSACQDARG